MMLPICGMETSLLNGWYFVFKTIALVACSSLLGNTSNSLTCSRENNMSCVLLKQYFFQRNIIETCTTS